MKTIWIILLLICISVSLSFAGKSTKPTDDAKEQLAANIIVDPASGESAD